MSLWERVRILPILVIVATLCFAVRLTEVTYDIRGFEPSAIAATPAQSAPLAPSKLPVQQNNIIHVADEKSAENATPTIIPAEREEPEWADPAYSNLDITEDAEKILRELTNRRKELDRRENVLQQREALLQATQQQIDQKMSELTDLRKDLEELLDQQKQEEEERILSLVKIYEGMKPKEAARIFNTLKMDILLSVVSRMTERKSSAIIASMDPDQARKLTILLAQQKRLPDMPRQDINLP
jgi:flagellar motility protein MotE (MotC chaperone)